MSDLSRDLQALVTQHGIEAVTHELRVLRGAGRRKAGAPTAIAFVNSLVLPLDVMPLLIEVARRFDAKQVFARKAEIKNFIESFKKDATNIRSRQSSIPVVFGYLSALARADLERLLKDGSMGGPSQLGPIADAIKDSAANMPSDDT